MTLSNQLYDAVLNGDAKAARKATEDALNDGLDPVVLVQEHMSRAMDEVGRLFGSGEYFVPELLLSARAMKAALELLRPLLAKAEARPAGRVVIGTIAGDLHDIGKNIVAAMLEGGGFEVTDLGTDVSPERFVKAIAEKDASIVCLSALLTVTMPAMRTTIDAFRAAGVRERVKVMVGGAPVNAQYAREIGADGYSENAAAAVALARRLIGELAYV